MKTEALNTQKLLGTPVEDQIAQLSQGDPRIDLLKGIHAGEVALPGTTERRFLATCQQSVENFSLLDLPSDVAQMILDSRAKSMQEFFDTWSESIRENAKRDKESHKRYRQKKGENTKTFDAPGARRQLRLILNHAKQSGQLDGQYYQNMMDSLQPLSPYQGPDGVESEQQEKLLERLSDIGQRLANLSQSKRGLSEPENGGVSLRSTNKV